MSAGTPTTLNEVIVFLMSSSRLILSSSSLIISFDVILVTDCAVK
jgi:hypothetical protein